MKYTETDSTMRNILRRPSIVVALIMGLLLASLAIGHSVQAQDAAEEGVFLPLVMNGDASQSGTPTLTPTIIPTATATATPTATPTVAATPTATPDPDRQPVVNGVCPAGTHLMHESGMTGILDPDSFDPQVDGWGAYGCYPDQTVDDISCSAKGAAQVIDGIAVCSCAEGFAGQLCELPAPEVEKPVAIVEGLQQSMEYGDIVQLRATNPAIAGAARTTAAGVWRVEKGNVCLLKTRDASECLAEITTDSAAGPFLQANDLGAEDKMALISFTPDCCPQTPALDTVIVQPPGYIPVNGYGRPQLEPVLGALEGFMQSRCVGAGLIGIAHYGNPVGVWGLGKIHGRASSEIFNEDCPDDDVDPHYPQAPNVSYTSPFKIGSVSKTTSYAITRWVIENRLREWDTDVDITALGNDRIVSAIRTSDGHLRLDAWQANGAGVGSHLSESETDVARDFAIAAVGDDRVVAAVRTVDNELKLKVWTVSARGGLTLDGESTVPGVKQVDVTAISDSRVVTAVKLDDDRFRLMTWGIAGGAPTMLTQDTAGRARDFEIVSAANGGQARVVAAVRTDSHTLKLIAWEVNGAGALNRVGDIGEPGYIHSVKLTALTGSRLAVAVRTAEKTLKVLAFDLSPTNVFTKLDDDDAGVTGALALSRIGNNGFAVVLSSQNGNLKVTTWVIESGQLVRRESATAGPTSALAATNIIYGSDTLNSILFVAARTAQDTLKIIPWNVTGPTPNRLDNAVEGAPIEDHPWSDNDIEALLLLGYDIPEGLLPDRLERLLSQKDNLPAFDPPIGDVASKSGTTGQIESCSALAQSADAQWQEVQLKHVFAHRTGLPRSAISYNTVVRDYLDELRGLTSSADYAAQELLLRSDPNEGNANVESGRTALGWSTAHQPDGSAKGYFVPQATLEEVLLAVAGRCLPHPLGEYTYSNTDPGFTRLIMEHLTGAIYAADTGYPDLHAGSILQQFFASELNMNTGATDNIFAGAVAVASGSDMPEPGPSARNWDPGAIGTAQIYNKGWDRKRPHCIIGDAGCSFNSWVSPSVDNPDPARAGRVNWYWQQEEVNLPYWTGGYGAATGGLRVEALPFLKFLKHYWTGTYGSNPSIGEARNNTWTPGRLHNGSLGGGYAYAVQFGGGGGCAGAVGVDVFVAVNQNSDTTEQSYSALYDVIRSAVCDVDWDEVEPYPFIYVAEVAP